MREFWRVPYAMPEILEAALARKFLRRFQTSAAGVVGTEANKHHRPLVSFEQELTSELPITLTIGEIIMPHALTIASAAAAFAITICAGSAAQACYKHTFNKCDGAMQIAEATASQGAEQPAKPRSPTASQGSG